LPIFLELIGPAVVRGISVAKGFSTADAVEFFALLSSTTAVVASNLILLFPRTTGAIQNSIAPRLDFRPILAFQKFGMTHV
jgi:hypothetical protein